MVLKKGLEVVNGEQYTMSGDKDSVQIYGPDQMNVRLLAQFHRKTVQYRVGADKTPLRPWRPSWQERSELEVLVSQSRVSSCSVGRIWLLTESIRCCV